ncbi:hypothetical protein CpecA_0718 [Chlamydia pecorum IPTaLE]|uniref:hypothetical protein n=1 Tax=Chlamydia pecorum TaxID=85991 RepID=UPI0003D3E29C|nr:hypothetical protein [Chlamydia pecorum]ETF40268.1 hypothetical protein CpecA_0718 [Chlamydia pecorum IPTaLE]
MKKNSHQALIMLPGVLWVVAGTKLILKAVSAILNAELPFSLSLLLSILSWGMSYIKHHYILKRSAETQHTLAVQLIFKRITAKKYLKASFLSKRFLIMVYMIFLSLGLRHLISHIPSLFILRATIGYALIRAAKTYFSLIQKTLPQT